MAVDYEDIVFRPFRYKIEDITLNIPEYGEYKVNPISVTQIILQKKFDTEIYPYFELTVVLPNKITRQMQEHNIDIKCNFHLVGGYSKAITDEDYSVDNYNEEEEIIWDQEVINQEFYVVISNGVNDITELNDESAEEEMYPEDEDLDEESYPQVMTESSRTIKMLLYNENYLAGIKDVINNVLRNATPMTAVMYILSKCGVKNVLFEKPTNNTSISELLLRPISAMENIDMIINNFSLHEGGTLLFFDLARAYCINKSTECKVWATNEMKKVHLMSMAKTAMQNALKEGCGVVDNEGYINITPNSYNFKNPSVMSDRLYGSNMVTIDTETGNITKQQSEAETGSMGSSYNVYISNGGDSSHTNILHTMRENSVVAQFQFSNVDIDFFTPNKEFDVTFDNEKLQKYQGKYRLSQAEFSLVGNGKTFSANALLTFKGDGQDQTIGS